MHIYAQALHTHTRTPFPHLTPTRAHTQTHTTTHPTTHGHTDPHHIHASAQTIRIHTHTESPPYTFNRDTSTVQVRMRVCGTAVCGYGSSGGLFAFIEGMFVFVHGCVCVSVCGGGV